MSITFDIETIPTGRFTIEGFDYESGEEFTILDDGKMFGSYAEAEAFYIANDLNNAYFYPPTIVAEMDVSDAFGVNMANDNAMLVMDLLGIEREYGGRMSADDLLSRTLETLAVPEAVVGHLRAPSDTGGPGTGRARVIDQGVDEARMDSYITRLNSLAIEAVRLGRDITWG